MEINLRIIQSLLTWHLWSIKHLSQLFPTCMKHKWGGYLHFTAITPFETVCKQFINGSVPFDYSLNSGFDTGMTAGLVEMSGRWAHLLRKCLQKQELGCREHSNFITSRGHRRKRWSGSNTSSIRKPSSSSEQKENVVLEVLGDRSNPVSVSQHGPFSRIVRSLHRGKSQHCMWAFPRLLNLCVHRRVTTGVVLHKVCQHREEI